MVNTRIGLAIFGASCLLAAGGGGYLASRHATAPAPQFAATAPAAGSSADASKPVQETEAVMEDHAAAPPPVATPAAPAPAASTPRSAKTTTKAAATRESGTQPAAGRVKPTKPNPVPAPARAQVPAVPAPADTPPPTESRADATHPNPAEPPRAEIAHRVEPVEQPKWQDELVVSADSVIGLQLKNTVSSETSQVEDRVEAQVARDVAVGGRVAIPAGSRVLGAVTLVERGGKMRDRARLGVRFHTLVLADGTTLPLQTDTVYREGESPASSSAAKMGGAAIGGAIVGAILGGGKGAVIGGATGAAGGTAAVMASSRRAATMTSGSTVTVRVLSPVGVTVEH